MGNIKRFEDLLVWRKSMDLSVIVYESFSDSKDYGFKDQIQRASVSVMNNIVEGFERNSNKEFKYFLFISKASCGEVRFMATLAKRLNYLNHNKVEIIQSQSLEISKMLYALIKKLPDKY